MQPAFSNKLSVSAFGVCTQLPHFHHAMCLQMYYKSIEMHSGFTNADHVPPGLALRPTSSNSPGNPDNAMSIA